MTTIQIALLAFAISLDSLGLMIVEGAMAPKIKHRELIKASLFIGGWQTLAVLLGNGLYPLALESGVWMHPFVSQISLRLLASLILVGLGLSMLRRGTRAEYINEQRQPFIEAKRVIMVAIITSIDAFLAGLGLSFAQINLSSSLFIILLISFICVILGTYIGYWFGYEEKPNAYRLSSIIYFVAATSLIV